MRVLEHMATACKSGLSIAEVIEHCNTQMIARVNRPLAQGRNSSRPRQSRFLIPADFKDLVQKPNDKSIQGDTTKNTCPAD